MPRPRKPKPQAVILPPELDDDDEEIGSVIPDDDGWIALEQGDADSRDGSAGKPRELVRSPAAKRKKRTRRDT